MNLIDLVDELYEEINGRGGMFGKKVDLPRCKELIVNIKSMISSSLSRAQEVIDKRNDIMQNADIVACNVIKEAEERASHITSNSEIIRSAENRAQAIMDETYRSCDAVVRKTKEHLDRMFAEAEAFFLNTVSVIRTNRGELRDALQRRDNT